MLILRITDDDFRINRKLYLIKNMFPFTLVVLFIIRLRFKNKPIILLYHQNHKNSSKFTSQKWPHISDMQ